MRLHNSSTNAHVAQQIISFLMMVVVSNCDGIILGRVKVKKVISEAFLMRRLLDEISNQPCNKLATDLCLDLVNCTRCRLSSHHPWAHIVVFIKL